ncbi:DUF3667 domain-containing protein [Nonlabens dokdonensis]|jgi:hypothetical protein|nr:DUF3667 domain-containing protein [Nonlabens dokdonensis]
MLYARQNFCSNCGSKWVDYRLTPKRIVTEVSNRYLGTDNVFLVTLIALLKYPEDVIDGYIKGQRKKYVNPASFYLISLTLIGLQIFILKHIAPDTLGFGDLKDAESVQTYVGYFYDYIGLFTTFFIPAYALTGYLVFIDTRKYNFSEHLVFCIYIFGFINILTFLLTPLVIGFTIDYQVISLIITPLTIVQFAWYYKRCFQLNLGQIVLKTLIAMIVFQIISVIYLIFFVVIIIGLTFLIRPELLKSITID